MPEEARLQKVFHVLASSQVAKCPDGVSPGGTRLSPPPLRPQTSLQTFSDSRVGAPGNLAQGT